MSEKLGIGDRVWVEDVHWGCDQDDCNCAEMGIVDGQHARMGYIKGTIMGADPCGYHHRELCTVDEIYVRLDRHRWYHYLWPWRPVRKLKAIDLQKLSLLERLADV